MATETKDVFKALNLPNPEIYRARSELALEVTKIIKNRGYTQKEASKITGISQPDISRLLKGDIGRFGLETLMKMNNKLGRHIELRLTKKPIMEAGLEVAYC